jgi:hypothetical protein
MVRVCLSIGGGFGLIRSLITLVVDSALARLVLRYRPAPLSCIRTVFAYRHVGCYADARLLQLARFDHYDGGVDGLNERNVNNFGKYLLSGDDTVLTVTHSSRRHYTFLFPRCKL